MLGEPLGRILAACALQNKAKLNNFEFDFIVPIPMHSIRERVRGYNHAERLANVLGKRLDLPVNTSLLRRSKLTKAQVGMTGDSRRKNLAGAFKSSEQANGRQILLVDDVSTTGSTLRECAKALKDSRAKAIHCITLAAG